MRTERWTIRAAGLGVLLAIALGGCRVEAPAPPAAPNAVARGAAARDKPFVASVLREPFHRSDCRWAAKISTENLAGYDKREQAIADGHRPCRVCRP